MYEVRYMEIPEARVKATVRTLPQCAAILKSIEKYTAKNPHHATKAMHEVNGNSIRFYESRLLLKQQIPKIRFRIQVYAVKKLVIVDHIAVYDHEMNELFIDN